MSFGWDKILLLKLWEPNLNIVVFMHLRNKTLLNITSSTSKRQPTSWCKAGTPFDCWLLCIQLLCFILNNIAHTSPILFSLDSELISACFFVLFGSNMSTTMSTWSNFWLIGKRPRLLGRYFLPFLTDNMHKVIYFSEIHSRQLTIKESPSRRHLWRGSSQGIWYLNAPSYQKGSNG